MAYTRLPCSRRAATHRRAYFYTTVTRCYRYAFTMAKEKNNEKDERSRCTVVVGAKTLHPVALFHVQCACVAGVRRARRGAGGGGDVVYAPLPRGGRRDALHSDGSKWYYIDGRLHRTDGPAVERADGTTGYWLDGYHVSFGQFERRRKNKKIKRQ